jgi:CRP/FNR family transcriptional activator FtrB
MRAVDLAAVRKVPLFAALDERQLGRLLCHANAQSHGAGTVIFEEGKEPEHLHVLLKGVVELYTTFGPRECGILLLSPGDIFMPAASLFAEPYLNSARVLRRARVLMVDVAAVRSEVLFSAELAIRLSRALAGQFRMAVRQIIDLKCRSAPQRLASFLLRLVDESSFSESAELPVSKRSLAARVGMTAETFSRTLQTLAENGLQVRGTRVIVHDRRRIEAFAGPRLYQEDGEAGLDVHAF